MEDERASNPTKETVFPVRWIHTSLEKNRNSEKSSEKPCAPIVQDRPPIFYIFLRQRQRVSLYFRLSLGRVFLFYIHNLQQSPEKKNKFIHYGKKNRKNFFLPVLLVVCDRLNVYYRR